MPTTLYPTSDQPDTNCLNCNEKLTGKYCFNCGQKADTQRFRMSSLWSQRFWDETFQLNRGLLRTLVQLYYRPGRIAAEYIGGHRKRYFNFVSLLLLLVASAIVVYKQIDHSAFIKINENLNSPQLRKIVNLTSFFEIFIEYYQLLVFLVLPPLGWAVWLLFRRMQLTYLEGVVAAAFLLSAQFVVELVLNSLSVLLPPTSRFVIGRMLVVVTYVIQPFVFGWQFSKGYYKTWGKLWRCVGLIIAAGLITSVIISFVIGFVDGYRLAGIGG